jgi:hypothetical protein
MFVSKEMKTAAAMEQRLLQYTAANKTAEVFTK